ncbi:5-formyltetrahydrofolate cyclo-ligase [Amycolatopsis acidicola]|uniref:5-formyltetrahydrofolate cyclo-ligase n=1 Tax=Amycolatopsis acidicola TaxID=2596893 RepID=A0A5N0USK8_9PSEU|nr:5-formyltetrahydrofolate cyclo-ligase [Amycolatopsis acidicola]KAA9154579.1 5-formyltetrahydrofolate cyclo-ligase [Amycolatopsis acidicola]
MCARRNDDLDKPEWRARISRARASISVQQRVSEARALIDVLVAQELPGTVCCYVPFGSEPGTVGWLDVLRGKGVSVLLPVITGPDALDWAEYAGPASLEPGKIHGILEPSGPRLGPDALARAGLVLVPALAVDLTGVRLGRGAGHYDRSLPHASPDAALVAVVRDDELVERLPAEEHDVRMTAALTPQQGLVPLPRDERLTLARHRPPRPDR